MADQNDKMGYPKLDVRAARALNPHTQTIRIESILGGHSHGKYFAARDEFQTSYGIDPGLSASGTFDKASGLIVPSGATKTATFGTSATVMWMVKSPKESTGVYMYDIAGSAYSFDGTSVTALSDAGSLSTSHGNGCEYYDNYIYFAKDNDVARYGPLNGTPAFDATYWTSTLSKAAINYTSYPYGPKSPQRVGLPNHVMHRHSDGKLYFADVVNNQGVLHVISTTKTTVEGDTDNGSTYQKLTFGYGLWPTAIESYGSQLVIALSEVTPDSGVSFGRTGRQSKAKVAFWDTTSANFNSITWVEFPDPIISSIKNAGGTLYFNSYIDYLSPGSRITRYVGGYSFQEVRYFDDISAPWPGAVAVVGSRYIFGSNSTFADNTINGSAVFTLQLQNQELGKGFFCIQRGGKLAGSINALTIEHSTATFAVEVPIFAEWLGISNQVVYPGGTYGSIDSQDVLPPLWRSQVFKIGQPFKVTKVRISTPAGLPTNASVDVRIYADQAANNTSATSTLIETVSQSKYVSTKKSIPIRCGVVGESDFFIEFAWKNSTSATSPLTIGLPVTIEYELIPD